MIIYDRNIQFNRSSYIRHSVYHNVVNYFDEEGNLLSIVNSRISPGPKRIWIGEEIDFLEDEFKAPQELGRNSLRHIVNNRESVPRSFRDNVSFSDVLPNESTSKIVETLDVIITDYLEKNVNDSRIDSMLYRMIYEKLEDYHQNNDPNALVSLLGFGPGLTPLGDDVVLGTLLCRNHLYSSREINDLIRSESSKRTLPISACFLRSACDNEFSDDFYELVRDVIIRHQLKESTVKRILEYGSSSGYGIIIGFTEQLRDFYKRRAV